MRDIHNTHKIRPIYPPWAKDRCKVVSEYLRPINSGEAAYGVALWVDYLDAKGALQTTMKWVKWDREAYDKAVEMAEGMK